MIKKLFFQGMLWAILISGCTPAGSVSPAVSQEPAVMREEEETVAADISEDPEIKNEWMIRDIFIPEDPCLKDTPFMNGSIECVLKYEPDLERIRSEERANGYLTYWIGDGIEYVTHFEDLDIIGVIISDNYSLSGGLKIGMKETELQERFPMMDKCEKGDLEKGEGMIVFASSIMNDKMGPLQTTDYDCVYAYSRGASDKEVEEYEINGTIAYSVAAFIKEGEVCKIVLDRPTAG